ncbi:MAG: RagB/SusD family nutrient uptake outer membrane protein [Prevotella sp.]
MKAKRYIKPTVVGIVALMTTGCNDYLDLVPKNDITTVETTFEKREDAEQWLMTCMSMRDYDLSDLRYNPSFWGSDEVVADEYTHTEGLGSTKERIPGIMIAEGKQKTQNPYGNIWSSTKFYGGIRYCNIFLANIDKTYNMEDEERNMWKGQVLACKGHMYFELIRRYGPIILVPENIDANADISQMQIPRSSIDDCVNATVELFDKAIELLPEMKGLNSDYYCFYSKEGVATLKAMLLLYAASPLFNGNEMFAKFTNKNGERMFPEYDKEKWKRAAEAADEAIELAKANGHQLESGYADRPTTFMNHMRDIEMSTFGYNYTNKEALVMIHNHNAIFECYYHPKVESQYKAYYDWRCESGVYPTLKMVETFYTEHGLPISEDKQWMANMYQASKETDERYKNVVMFDKPVLNLHRRREPRFYADIIAHGTCWYHKMSSSSSKYEAIDCNMLKGEKYGTNQSRLVSNIPQCITGYYVKKYDVSDVSKYNYQYNVGYVGDRADILWRLADLLLASAEAWNEYLDAPDERVYAPLDEVRERAGILPVRQAWETYARNPKNVTTKAGMRSIIRQEQNIELCFEGKRFFNVRRWMTAPEECNQSVMGWNILATTDQKFYNDYRGPKVVWKDRSFTVPRDYFFPINAEEILISGVRQNMGW